MSTHKSSKKLQSRLQKTPVAIVGISSIFPNSKNLNEYWSNIINEIDCITDVPPSRWNIDDYYNPDPKVPDKAYSKRGAFIPDIEFNPLEFGLPPNILELTEVAQLLTLVLTRDLLLDAGYAEADDELRKMTGVILGVGGAQKLMTPLMSRLQYPIWQRVLESVGIVGEPAKMIIDRISKAYIKWEENSFPGALGNITSGRIANRFNLGGTNCVVDAACASSLAGIRMAVHELLDYRSDMMITGGVDMDNSIYAYLCFSKTPAFSKGEKLQPFDKDSAGMLIGEGAGMLLLKRLEDAERDNDQIYAVIKGIGTSSDGRSKSIYAPRSEGQIIALERAYQDAGFSPSTVGLIEAHGTGTPAGDVAEVNALKMLFENHETPHNKIALGSVKSQMGHTKNAAGVAGLIKAALALQHKILPATINVNEPNPKLEIETSPLYLNTEVRPWITNKMEPPRRAGVSAFGFGGTNFHLVMEEHQKDVSIPYRLHETSVQILLQAGNANELLQKCKQMVRKIDSDVTVFQQLSSECKAAELSKNNARLGFVVSDKKQCLEKLNAAILKIEQDITTENWELPGGVFFRSSGLDLDGKVVALFAGQGSPYVNMGRELACNFPPLRDCFEMVDQHMLESGNTPVSKVVYPNPTFLKSEKQDQAKALQKTENAQPAIGAFSAGQFKILNQAGFNPDYTAGHSFGELTALWAAGVFSETEYLKLAKSRGEAMAAPADPDFDAGSMLAVVGDLANLKQDIAGFENIVLANINSHQQIVLAGPKEDINKVQDHLKNLKYRAIPLPVSAAFHTPLVAHAQKPFATALDQVKFNKPKIAVYSNATGKKHSLQTQAIKKKLKEHILQPVNFKDEITNIYKDGGYLFIEFGPQNILCKLVDNILKDQPHISIAINRSASDDSDYLLKEAVVKMRVAGVNLGDIDPYAKPEKKQETGKKAMSIMINGSNYVSDKTKIAFESALAEKHSFIEDEVNKQVEAYKKSQPPIQTTMSRQVDQKKINTQIKNQPVAQPNVDRSLEHFYQHQNETLKVHDQFLKQQAEYSKSFMQIMLQQTQSTNPNAFSADVADSINQFHRHQSDTLRVHENYLNQQVSYSKESFQFIKQLSGQPAHYSEPLTINTTAAVQYAEPVNPPVEPKIQTQPLISTNMNQVIEKATPVAVPAVAAISTPEIVKSIPEQSTNAVETSVLKIVSDKTGYLPDMLDLTMDMEADLGIDSIKRVEIINCIQDEFPNAGQISQAEISEITTLGQIVALLSNGKSVSTPEPVSTSSQPMQVPGIKTEPEKSTQSAKDLLLQVVSEKTGYLIDMLDLEMDMEADLGIDSIKRVEILNDVKDKLPGSLEINNDQLSEKRTLKEICQFLDDESGNEESTTPVQQTGVVSESPAISAKMIEKTLIAVISEKTGYVEEMLELDMDLEADLGIDSIKRVEILNGIQEKQTGLPNINPDALSELRTLRQIVEFLVSNAGSVSTDPKKQDGNQNNLQETEISSSLLNVVSDKTGYPQDMLDMNMDMEADLGIDSIKRVEIINSLQEAFPALGIINPDELTEIKTLQEIVNFIKTVKKKIPN